MESKSKSKFLEPKPMAKGKKVVTTNYKSKKGC